jgi:hypothetical protein
MTPEEVHSYYDIPENARAMCSLLMRAHPGWTVWRQSANGMCHIPLWCARRTSWPDHKPPFISGNAGLLNTAMTMMDTGSVTT